MSSLIDFLNLPPWLSQAATIVVTLAIATMVALIIHTAALKLLKGFTAKTPGHGDDLVVARAALPTRWIVIGIAWGFAQRTLVLPGWTAALWQQAAGFVVPALIGWLAINLIRAAREIVDLHNDVSVEDNLHARRRRTRVTILTRIAIFCVIFLSICMMLLSIPAIRNIGVTLMASAGLAGLAVGAAAQPALKNLIAGVQLAFAEPIRLDDVVIIDGEWGRIEEIRLTYVVLRIWDERRLVVPISKFLEDSFQNWTRSSAELLGSVFLYVDPATNIARLRTHADAIIRGNDRWDQRFWNLRVTDAKSDVLEVRILATAKDAPTAFDLRCDIREEMMAFIAKVMPQAIPRRRFEPFVASAQ